jgi:hypothetical protein
MKRVLVGKRDVHGKLTEFKQHPDDELVDRVEMKIVPRFKQSGMSGDEWRTSGQTRMFHKGMLLYERAYLTLADAAKHLPWLVTVVGEELLFSDDTELNKRHDALVDSKGKKCMQAGCSKDATHVFQINELFSERGHKLDATENERFVSLRAFCDEHAERGDCDREDCDDNYLLVEEVSTMTTASQKRSGVVISAATALLAEMKTST